MLRRAAVLAALFAICAEIAAQQTNLEDRLKATFIYNFIQYAEWPRQSLASTSPFTICLVGDLFQTVMEDTVRGENLNGRSITVRSLLSAEGVSGCHLIYFRDEVNSRIVSEILGAAKALPILTVGEGKDFIQAGGIIRFTKTANRIRFEINPQAAEKQSLSLSSRLLRLAEIVHAP
jgi:hypothetical protein